MILSIIVLKNDKAGTNNDTNINATAAGTASSTAITTITIT